MGNGNTDSASRLVQRLLRLGRQLYRSEGSGDLTPAQQAALRYLAAANRFSRTVAGFARYHVTTESTASEIVTALDRRGLVTRTRWPEDRRRIRIDLTERGKELLDGDPVLEAADAIRDLPGIVRERLIDNLQELATEVGRRTGSASFGVCDQCVYADQSPSGGDDIYCRQFEASLAAGEADRLCVAFEAASESG